MKQYRVSVRFSAELRKRLAAAARRTGVRESELVRDAVENHLAAEDKKLTAYDLANAAGLIGTVKGAAPDLSTNPDHFEGFGSS